MLIGKPWASEHLPPTPPLPRAEDSTPSHPSPSGKGVFPVHGVNQQRLEVPSPPKSLVPGSFNELVLQGTMWMLSLPIMRALPSGSLLNSSFLQPRAALQVEPMAFQTCWELIQRNFPFKKKVRSYCDQNLSPARPEPLSCSPAPVMGKAGVSPVFLTPPFPLAQLLPGPGRRQGQEGSWKHRV